MNIIIKRGKSDRPVQTCRGVPIRFDTYRNAKPADAVEVVREAAKKYGGANRQMMNHELNRMVLGRPIDTLDDRVRNAEIMEAGVEEISRQMDPNGTPGIEVRFTETKDESKG